MLDKRRQPEFVVFRRFGEKYVRIFEIQRDKYLRPKFVINFYKAPPDGIQFGGQWMPAKDLTPVHCGSYLRLMRSLGRFGYSWFQPGRPFIQQLLTFKRNYEPEEIAAQVVDRFQEIEDWWAHRVIDAHVKNF